MQVSVISNTLGKAALLFFASYIDLNRTGLHFINFIKLGLREGFIQCLLSLLLPAT